MKKKVKRQIIRIGQQKKIFLKVKGFIMKSISVCKTLNIGAQNNMTHSSSSNSILMHLMVLKYYQYLSRKALTPKCEMKSRHSHTQTTAGTTDGLPLTSGSSKNHNQILTTLVIHLSISLLPCLINSGHRVQLSTLSLTYLRHFIRSSSQQQSQ